jgi:beta-galactosidase
MESTVMNLGVCYYPEQWPESKWEPDARRMADSGITQVRIAEFAWSRMEPSRNEFQWDWLDRAIATLAGHGLKVILGTPTAAPPKWLVDELPEILPVDINGLPFNFGSRRHYDLSSPAYRRECARIVEAMAARYGDHPAVVAWQTDNELGMHYSMPSYSNATRTAFRAWLRARYDDIGALNTSWGNVFWSMEYDSFDGVDLPIRLPTDVNPIHMLDFRRFLSAEVASFHKLQADILRRHAPGRDVFHNFTGFYTGFDHFEFARAGIDIAAWDSYPIPRTSVIGLDDEVQAKWARTGHPDVSAFCHDLYRAIGKGRFSVMEQQAGPVNWGAWNPIPLPGMVRLWAWEAFAHGAELVSFFRWRQYPMAQEQMHSGLNLPDDRYSPGGHEVRQVGRELRELAGLDLATGKAGKDGRVALVFDYQADWVIDIQPHGKDFRYMSLAFEYYSTLRELDLEVDFVTQDMDLSGYRLVVAPTLPMLSPGLTDQLAKSGGATWVFGPRSGSKTGDYAIPPNLPPGALQAVLPIRVNAVESLQPGLREPLRWGAHAGHAQRWREQVEPMAGASVEARFHDGSPAVISAALGGSGKVTYLAGWFDRALHRELLAAAASNAGLDTQRLPEGVRLQRRGKLCFVFNFGPGNYEAPASASEFRLGGRTIEPGQLAAWRI